MENCLSNPTNVISGTTNVGNVCGNASTGCEVNYCYYLTYVATDDIYCGNSTITPANCNIFRVMDTKYQVYNAGNSVISTYPADADLCDIMNDWVNAKNATSPGYLSWKYESSLMEFIE